MSSQIARRIEKELGVLSDELQRQVLKYMQTLKGAPPRGVSGKELLRFAGAIPPRDLLRMSRAIEAGCERVDADR